MKFIGFFFVIKVYSNIVNIVYLILLLCDEGIDLYRFLLKFRDINNCKLQFFLMNDIVIEYVMKSKFYMLKVIYIIKLECI